MWRCGDGFGLTLMVGNVAAAPAQSPRIGVDRRVELMAILFKLAGSPEYNRNGFGQYNADIARYFGPFRDDEAVTRARVLRERHGIGYGAVMSIAIRVTDPPALEPRVPFDSGAGWPGPPDAMRGFVEAARQFAIVTRADSFFKTHRVLYDSASARLRRPLERRVHFAWLGPFFGVPPDRDRVVVPLLANSETNFGNCVRPERGRQECYTIIAHGGGRIRTASRRTMTGSLERSSTRPATVTPTRGERPPGRVRALRAASLRRRGRRHAGAIL